MAFLDTTCVTTITAGTLNSFDLAWSTSHLYVQTFSRSSYNSMWFFFLHCLSLQISLYWIHFYGIWSSSGNTRHALKLKNLVFLETSRQGESENRKAPGKFRPFPKWTTLTNCLLGSSDFSKVMFFLVTLKVRLKINQKYYIICLIWCITATGLGRTDLSSAALAVTGSTSRHCRIQIFSSQPCSR